MTRYAELHCLSNFSFQRGASSALELFTRAQQLGYSALAITDECTLAGVVRAWQAAQACQLPLIVGSEFVLDNGARVVLLVRTMAGYQTLCHLITLARRRAEKGTYQALAADYHGVDLTGLLALWLPSSAPQVSHGQWLKALFGDRLWLAVELHRGVNDAQRLAALQRLGHELGVRCVASGDVHMHARGRRALQDTLTAIRHHLEVAQAGAWLFANGERHVRSLSQLAELYPPTLLEETLCIAQQCTFNLDQLRYHYPHEVVPAGHTPDGWLRELTQRGMARRWPSGAPTAVLESIERELSIIADLAYASYFLTVHDIVDFARRKGILCQGRGSAANSAVCFALGITAIDPAHTQLLFERFISRERNEPPDIDVDFEHDRREEVIQYVFSRYGRDRAALTAIASTYRAAGALRDVAKALGLPPDQISALAECAGRHSDTLPSPERLVEAGFDPESPILRRVLVLTGELIGFPRHLSQHPGGFVISEHPLHTLVPVENAAMEGRTVIQWDKDDLDQVGLLKVDLLALGMLSALRRCFDLVKGYRGQHYTLATLPKGCPATYEMIGRADTVGVFQIESRAQMAMLPRLKPQNFYDLVIEVAIVRPGPIQGDMVHPYLRRRNREEAVDYPSPALEAVLKRTLGVPLFQEQVMQLAIVAADYTPGEADQLRRAMAAWKRHGGMGAHQVRLREGMLRNGYTEAFAQRVFEQIKGFGSYGFPESHAASFALLTYASSWLKCHEPAAFACALVNSWPMGFYSPDQVFQDARRHGVQVHPVDVRYSEWDCTLEAGSVAQPAIRMGLRMIRGLQASVALRMSQARACAPFSSLQDLATRAGLCQRSCEQLADAGALQGLAGHRHRARWDVASVEQQLPLFAAIAPLPEPDVLLPAPTVGEDLLADYAAMGTTLGSHPLALLRASLRPWRCRSSRELGTLAHGRSVSVTGLVTSRQRPGTASGVTFVTLEDEFGMVNVIVWRDLAERQRKALVGARLLQVQGRFERQGEVCHLVARNLIDMTRLLSGLEVRSRDFH